MEKLRSYMKKEGYSNEFINKVIRETFNIYDECLNKEEQSAEFE